MDKQFLTVNVICSESSRTANVYQYSFEWLKKCQIIIKSPLHMWYSH